MCVFVFIYEFKQIEIILESSALCTILMIIVDFHIHVWVSMPPDVSALNE